MIKVRSSMFMLDGARHTMLCVVVFGPADRATECVKGKFTFVEVVVGMPAAAALLRGGGVASDNQFACFSEHVGRGLVQ